MQTSSARSFGSLSSHQLIGGFGHRSLLCSFFFFFMHVNSQSFESLNNKLICLLVY